WAWSSPGSCTGPWGPRPMWQWASTRPGTTHPPVATVSAPATGSEVMRPSTIQRSRSVASGSTTPLTCRGVVIAGMLRAVPSAPVHAGDFPDPFVLVAGERYWAYGTQTGDCNVQVMESGDLRRWVPRGDALPELPGW